MTTAALTQTQTSRSKGKTKGKDKQPYTNPVYKYVTDRVIKAIKEDKTLPWTRGFMVNNQWPRNASTGHKYRGINVFNLSYSQEQQGYKHNLWITFNQAKDLKGTITKGEKSPMIVVFYKIVDKRTPGEKKEHKHLMQTGQYNQRYKDLNAKVYMILRYTNVFNIEQTEGIDPERLLKYAAPPQETNDHSPIQQAEELLNGWTDAPEIKYAGNRPHYNPAQDRIVMPPIDRYETPERFYKTRYHESAHATGHESRLNRPGVAEVNRMDEEKYSFEELIAELTAAMLCQITGIQTDETENNTDAYINGWLKVFESNPKILVQAASKANQAADYIQGITYNEREE